MDPGIATLLIGAAGGLGFFALRYPATFERLFLPAVAVLIVVGAAFLLWNNAVLLTFGIVEPLIPEASRPAAQAAAATLRIGGWPAVALYAGAFAYLFLLAFVSRLLQRREEELEQGRKRDDHQEGP